MRILSFRGSPRAIGRAFGESCREEMRELYALRLANTIGHARKHAGRELDERAVLEVARACLEPTRAYHPAGFEELEGLAEGAGMSLARVLALNGLTDLRDVVTWSSAPDQEGCTSFIARGDATRDGGTIYAQTWDLLTDNGPYVLAVHRRPDDGPATWCFTTVGCLSLIGLNEEGIAVGTTNLKTLDGRPGVIYLSVLHRALACRSYEDAARSVTEAARAGAHYYFVGYRDERACGIECSATEATRIELREGTRVQTNHCLVPANRARQAALSASSSSSSKARLERARQLLASASGRLDVAAARRILSDRENGEDAILREDYNDTTTNGAVVMLPGRGELWACGGLPDRAEWVELVSASQRATCA